ncbi:ead/Ea22-like family protein [Escherichia coli]|uniref:ead/Ea22-like family protein n=1 Tax=Escherichia coli TaxID=562 RepID=UPI0018E0E056|nr:ead/Ea22-like family protein [Escherichia coli]MBI1433251.1 ead/Ea22-like family protein [Escherichia coli]MBI1458714.1 ead/Ea22-like family protein [Escherichia coli]
MSKIDYQALREAAVKAGKDKWQAKKINGDFFVIRHGSYTRQHGYTSYQPIAEIGCKPVRDFVARANPATVLALLDERERNQQYIKRRDQENEDIALTVGKLRVELEAAKSKPNEQREYYEGVIADGSNHIAELEKQCAEWERKALSNFEECAAMAERIEEMEKTTTGQDANINSQQERVAQSANRHVYHYNAVSNVSGITMSGIAQSPFRIKSQSDLEEFKSALSKVCGFHATAVTSLSYLGREEEE